MTPLSLRLLKKPVIKAVSADFYSKWTATLQDGEQRLIKLLLELSHHVIEKLGQDFDDAFEALYGTPAPADW